MSQLTPPQTNVHHSTALILPTTSSSCSVGACVLCLTPRSHPRCSSTSHLHTSFFSDVKPCPTKSCLPQVSCMHNAADQSQLHALEACQRYLEIVAGAAFCSKLCRSWASKSCPMITTQGLQQNHRPHCGHLSRRVLPGAGRQSAQVPHQLSAASGVPGSARQQQAVPTPRCSLSH